MKILLDISRTIWANVKYYATVEDLPLNLAVKQLLEHSLEELVLNSNKKEKGFE